MYRRMGSRSPSECSPGTKSLDAPSRSIATLPIRDMILMLATTYGLSVASTPTLLIGESVGPMMYGTTYIVRPRIAPSSSAPTLCFAAPGSIQLFVGPASSLSREQINVRCSVRATSFGLLRCKWQFGYVFSLSCTVSLLRSISAVIRWYSASDPSQYTRRSGFVSAAASFTQVSSGVATLLPPRFHAMLPLAARASRGAYRTALLADPVAWMLISPKTCRSSQSDTSRPAAGSHSGNSHGSPNPDSAASPGTRRCTLRTPRRASREGSRPASSRCTSAPPAPSSTLPSRGRKPGPPPSPPCAVFRFLHPQRS